MNYQETIDYLFTRLPMFQRTGKAAYKDNLDNTILLDELYHHPHTKYKTIHVAGTNGKGSVSHQIAAILQWAGYKTGLYTSPHLKDFRERIRVDGKKIEKQQVIEWVEDYNKKVFNLDIEPSFFELTVAMAFDFFAQQQVDIAVIEVGLGGRLDSTNIITPELSVITNIGLDHTALLGDTIEKIAWEKAGIIKNNIPVVIGQKQPKTTEIFQNKAKKHSSEIFFAEEIYTIETSTSNKPNRQCLTVYENGELQFDQLQLDLKGWYQKKNLPAVLASIGVLQRKGWNISDTAIKKGLENTIALTGMLGRWQILSNKPLIISDTGHNVDGVSEVVKQLKSIDYEQLHIVFGMVNDKDIKDVLSLLPKNATYYFTKASIKRALDENILTEKAREFDLKGEKYPTVEAALAAAKLKASEKDCIFIGGSTFVVAEVL